MRLFAAQFVLALGLAHVNAEEAPRQAPSESTRKRLKAAMPAYDPGIRAAAVADGTVDATASRVTRPMGRSSALKQPASKEAPTELPRMVVEAPRMGGAGSGQPAPLPVLPRVEQFKHVEAEPFETDEARERRLSQTYLSDLDRLLLNRVTLPGVGKSQGERAKELARIDAGAEALNRLALIIEVLEASGASPEEVKALREEYARLFTTRPR